MAWVLTTSNPGTRGEWWIDDWRALAVNSQRASFLGTQIVGVVILWKPDTFLGTQIVEVVCAVTFHIIQLLVLFDFSYLENTFSFFLFWQFARRRFWLHVMTYEQRPERPAQLTLRSAALQRFPLPHPGPPLWFPFENVHAPVMLSI